YRPVNAPVPVLPETPDRTRRPPHDTPHDLHHLGGADRTRALLPRARHAAPQPGGVRHAILPHAGANVAVVGMVSAGRLTPPRGHGKRRRRQPRKLVRTVGGTGFRDHHDSDLCTPPHPLVGRSHDRDRTRGCRTNRSRLNPPPPLTSPADAASSRHRSRAAPRPAPFPGHTPRARRFYHPPEPAVRDRPSGLPVPLRAIHAGSCRCRVCAIPGAVRPP